MHGVYLAAVMFFSSFFWCRYLRTRLFESVFGSLLLPVPLERVLFSFSPGTVGRLNACLAYGQTAPVRSDDQA